MISNTEGRIIYSIYQANVASASCMKEFSLDLLIVQLKNLDLDKLFKVTLDFGKLSDYWK